jgi:ketosteroid isomerase-like protein
MNETTQQLEEQLRDAWQQFADAMERNDADALGALLDDDFTLGHMTGYRQPRAEWIADIAAGNTAYHSVRTLELVVEAVDTDTPVVTARTETDVTIGGERGSWRTAFTVRYRRAVDGGWTAVSADGSSW